MILGPFDAILFDFDGVLVDSEPLHWQCWREVIEPFGIDLTWEAYATNCIGVSDRSMIRALCRIADNDTLFDPIWAEYPRKKAMLRERIGVNVPMPAATRVLLDELRGSDCAVVSSSGRLEIEPALEAAGVRSVFRTIVTSEDVERLKPAPEPYLTAAARLGARCPLVVEDSEAGIQSGLAAGFAVLRVPSAESMAGLLRERLRLGRAAP